MGRVGLAGPHAFVDIGSIKKRASFIIGLSLLLVACGLPAAPSAARVVHPRLVAKNQDRLPIRASVQVLFDRAVDPQDVHLTLTPTVSITAQWQGNRLTVLPSPEWAAATSYMLSIAPFQDKRLQVELKPWQGSFRTQPRVVAVVELDGRPVGGSVTAGPGSTMTLSFPLPMRPDSVQLFGDDRPLDAHSGVWSDDRTNLSLSLAQFVPGHTIQLSIAGGTTELGDLLTEKTTIKLTSAVLEPSNAGSGVPPGFVPPRPIEIVVENSGPARPQLGLQAADVVVEYISEYSISRMTAIYFNSLPSLVGPVRSCRMINIPLNFSFGALGMCSGASDGTLGQLWRQGVPVVINDYDHGNHFFRSAARSAPHNLYTSGDRALRLRQEMPGVPTALLVDPPHDDIELGAPAAAPVVPLHAVSYSYDTARRVYLRFDHGAPFIDASSRAQLSVKTVAIMHAPFRDAGWVEDVNGGAHSIIYDLAGQGPAELYSDGRLINATWHMDNGVPLYFTDEHGQVVRINTGLTWVHVLGNGQNH